MSNNCTIAGIGVEGVFWLIVIVISIISQLIKASKKIAPSGQKGALNDKISVGNELENFLNNLTGAPPSNPQPVLTDQDSLPVSKAQSKKRNPQPPLIKSKLSTVPPLPHQKRKTQKTNKERTMAETQEAIEPLNKISSHDILRNSVETDLIDTQTIRKAIALREILGPPIALQ